VRRVAVSRCPASKHQAPTQAEEERFLGSPSVRVEGVDIEPGAGERTDFGLKCRLYRTSEGQSGYRLKTGSSTPWAKRQCDDVAGLLHGQRAIRAAQRASTQRQNCRRHHLTGIAALAARRSGMIRVLGAPGAGWLGASHLVAARTGYAGCPALGAIPSLIRGRDVQVGCVPWRIADRELGLST
jgi:hypothetical protein